MRRSPLGVETRRTGMIDLTCPAVIVSNTADVHSDFLVDACNRQGVDCLRINTDRFRRSGRIVWQILANQGILEVDGRRCCLPDIGLLVYRRPTPVHRDRHDVELWIGLMLDNEWDAVENSLSSIVECNVVNTVQGLSIARNKLAQLKFARSSGLNVPVSLVSNDSSELKRFAQSFECVTKGIESAYSIVNGVMRSGLTRRVTLDDLADYDCKDCPTFLQQRILPAAMWRIVLVGPATFGFRFTGPLLDQEIDSRLIESQLHGEHLVVPNEVAAGLKHMCRQLSILYASSDFIEDRQGDLWFVDLNPEGQWAVYENKFGIGISDHIIQLSRRFTPVLS